MEVLKSELDIFTDKPVQMSVEQGKWVVYNPISTLDNNNTIEFNVPASTEECVDPALTMLHLKVQILKAGKPLTDADNTAPVNNFLHSLFAQVEVSLNQKLVSAAANTYPYRAYIETLLNYDQSAKDTHLTSALWYKDTAGKFNDVTATGNDGFVKRKALSRGMTELFGPVLVDLFNINRYLLTCVELGLKLIRFRDSFALMSDTQDLKIKIRAAALTKIEIL